MKLAAGIFAFNTMRHGRREWLGQVIDALESGGITPFAIAQGQDDTGGYLSDRLGTKHVLIDRSNTAIWYGQTRLYDRMAEDAPDWMIFLADDVILRDGWRAQVDAYCASVPDDVVLTSLHLEPWFPWATIHERVEYGGVEGLSRDSVPGDSWLFRPRDWPLLCSSSFPTLPAIEPGPDLTVCQRLRADGYRLVQLDLADHVGAMQSTWGNKAYINDARPLDRERWGLRDVE